MEKLELSTLENGLIFEIIFGLGHLMVGLLINSVGKFPIICKCCVESLMVDSFVIKLFLSAIVFISLITGLSGIFCMLTDVPALQISLFLSLLSCGIAGSVVSSVTIEIYPTALR